MLKKLKLTGSMKTYKISRTNTKKRCAFHHRGLEWKIRKSRDTWNNRQVWPSKGFPCGSAGKEFACNVGDLGSIPGLGRSPGEGNGYPFQYSSLENSMDCIVCGVAKNWTQLSNFHLHFHFGLRMQNEVGQRLTEFCQENTLVKANTLFQQYKRWLYTWISPDGQYWNQIDYILCSQRWRKQSAKIRPGADCASDHELLISKFRFKLKKVGKTTRPFRCGLNQTHYDYTAEVTNRFKWLDTIDSSNLVDRSGRQTAWRTMDKDS